MAYLSSRDGQQCVRSVCVYVCMLLLVEPQTRHISPVSLEALCHHCLMLAGLYDRLTERERGRMRLTPVKACCRGEVSHALTES